MQGEAAMVPENVGKKAAHMLLEEIARGGVTDGTHQVNHIAWHFSHNSFTSSALNSHLYAWMHICQLFHTFHIA